VTSLSPFFQHIKLNAETPYELPGAIGRVSQAVDLRFTPDPLFIFSFVMAGLAGQYFSLKSVGVLLGFNATTLWQGSLFWTFCSLPWIIQAPRGRNQLKGMPFAIIPIALRRLLRMPVFEQLVAATSPGVQFTYLFEVMGLWNLVSVHEEACRAALLFFVSGLIPDEIEFRSHIFTKIQMVVFIGFVVNSIWIGYHFLQRPLDLALYWKYILWLYCSGFVFTYVLAVYGLGAAVWVHTITNVSA
jgi:hypothetical protein